MRQDVRFYLGDGRHVLDDLDPVPTLPDWLRRNQGRTGTRGGQARGKAATRAIAAPAQSCVCVEGPS